MTMRKIPTLFVRDPEDMRYLTREVHPDCQWVIDGEGVPTRKYDGTCVRFDGEHWWARREIKPGKTPPAGFVAEQTDEVTGKTVGWEPAEQSPFAKYLREAVQGFVVRPAAGTFELCGPKVQGNPEGYAIHTLVRHADAEVIDSVVPTYEWLAKWMPSFAFEGIVWHHPDGRMAKIKRRDFRP
jgi:hypothetical protein